MSEKAPEKAGRNPTRQDRRKERLASALRDNLKRRKRAQTDTRAEPESSKSAAPKPRTG